MSSLFPSRMIAPSRLSAQCQRTFASSAALYSGHNRWSKIRHDKGAADQKKTAQRSTFAKKLMLYSKRYGPDPNRNTALAGVIAAAKKAGMPKASIDVAIARGQGRSISGTRLENAMLEVMVPAPAPISLIISIETDNKQRSLKDLRLIVKNHGATVAATAFLFERQGRVALKSAIKGTKISFDDVILQASFSGADDVVEPEAKDTGEDADVVVVHTKADIMHEVAQEMAEQLRMKIVGADIIWLATSDKVALDDEEAAKSLGDLLAEIADYPDTHAVYSNAEKGAISDEAWDAVKKNLEY